MHDDQDSRRKGRLSREDMMAIESGCVYYKRALVEDWDVSDALAVGLPHGCMPCTTVVIRDRGIWGRRAGGR